MSLDSAQPGDGSPARPRTAIAARIPLVLLAVAVAGSAAFILGLTSKITFVTDEWDLLLLRSGWGAGQLLDPFHEHIVLAPAFIYKVFQTLFGMDSARPYQLAATGTFLLTAVLFFAYVRRRVGDWAALIMACLILFLGAAFEDLLWAFQIGYFGSLAAGLSALIALDRDDRRGDVCASVLLVVSLCFSSLGLPFVAGAAAEWILNPRDRGRRIFVPGAAILLFALWWLGWGHRAESELSLSNIPDLPSYLFTAISAGFTAIAGLATGDGSEPDQPHLIWGKLFLVVALLLAAWRLRRRGSVPRGLLVVATAGLAFYLLAGLNQSDLRPPASSRYQLPSAIFILLTASWVLEGLRIRAAALIAAALISALAIGNGLQLMKDQAESRWQPGSQSLLTSLGAIDLAGDTVRSGYTLLLGLDRPVPIAEYRRATDDFGSPGKSEAELADGDSAERVTADSTLVNALGIELAGRPAARRSRCGPLKAGEARTPPGRSLDIFNRGKDDLGIALARFSDPPGVEIGSILPGVSAGLDLPRDRSVRPWRIAITRGGPAEVCG
ncbi:MAG TPA: hypothetical protein VMF31_10025 [Solirubrobacterales bacterium]|nr:hypothetical protein [Solirubrobacterales bacterium]